VWNKTKEKKETPEEAEGLRSVGSPHQTQKNAEVNTLDNSSFIHGFAWGCADNDIPVKTLLQRIQQEEAVLVGMKDDGTVTIKLPLYHVPCCSWLFPKHEYVLLRAVPESWLVRWKAPAIVSYIRLSYMNEIKYKYIEPIR
jgi:hypothetical protein